MLATDVNEAIAKVAAETGIEPAALAAIAEIESGGVAHAAVDGRREPLIRFEGHYFDRRLTEAGRARARAAGLSSPVAGGIANPASQVARWRLLERAAAIDRKAAYESTSWGVGQVMGTHWAWLGYADIDAFVAEARAGAAGQVRQMARYIVKAGLAAAIARRDWPTVARGYNGPAYAKNRYDRRLATAFARHSPDDTRKGGTTEVEHLLRRGDSGTLVANLQAALSAAGYTLEVDGDFGPLTDAAVRRFQRDNGLLEDGIAGPRTRAALAAKPSMWTRLWRLLLALFRAGSSLQ